MKRGVGWENEDADRFSTCTKSKRICSSLHHLEREGIDHDRTRRIFEILVDIRRDVLWIVLFYDRRSISLCSGVPFTGDFRGVCGGNESP